MAYFFLGLAFVGAVLPYSFLGQFFFTYGLDTQQLKIQILQSPVASFLGTAMAISILVTLIFIFAEGRRLKMKGVWLPLLATLLVGISCSLPLFLYLRHLALEKNKETAPTEAAPIALPGPGAKK